MIATRQGLRFSERFLEFAGELVRSHGINLPGKTQAGVLGQLLPDSSWASERRFPPKR